MKVFVFVFCKPDVNLIDEHSKHCLLLQNSGYITETTHLNSRLNVYIKPSNVIFNQIEEAQAIAVFGKIDYDNEFFRFAMNINKPILSKMNYIVCQKL